MTTIKNTYLAALAVLLSPIAANASIITFDDAISGQSTYMFDADGDTINDVTFSTTDPSGFNTVGPGPNQLYIQEPGLEGTTSLVPDLRVDFIYGALSNLSFGFALNTNAPSDGVTFNVYDALDNLLGTQTVMSAYYTLPGGGNSVFPEGLVSLSFAGLGAYATLNFSNNQASRYIIDNFAGTFGSNEVSVPEPGTLALLGLGLAGIGFTRREKA